MVVDESLFTVLRFFDVCMEDHLFCSDCKPGGDSFLCVFEICKTMQITSGNLSSKVGLKSHEEGKFLFSLVSSLVVTMCL